MAMEQHSDQLHEQHAVFVKEEPPDESEMPLFRYETVTKQELILEDELPEGEQSGDEAPNGTDTPADEDRYKHFKCPECFKLFKRKRGANTCQRKHEVLRLGLFECKICKKRFPRMHTKKEHEEAHKRGTIKMFGCDTCSMRFCSQKLLKKHEEVHTGVLNKLFGCKICEKRFVNKAALGRHIKVHMGIELPPQTSKPVDNRPYKCSECNNKFDSLLLLKRCFKKHEARQLGYFKCSYCGVHLGTRNYLKRHEARHRFLEESGKSDTLYRCKKCHKGFMQQEMLMKHVIAHEVNAEKIKLLVTNADGTFTCIECNKTFTQRRYANVHVGRHIRSKQTTFQCKTCNLQCADSYSLSIHIQMHVKDGEALPQDMPEDEDEPEEGSDLDSEADMVDLVEPDEETKQFYIIEEIPESAVVKQELQMLEVGEDVSLKQSQLIKAEPDVEQIIPHSVVGGELPMDEKPNIKEELIIPV